MGDIAEGMKYLHSSGIIHRDLKSGNVLLNADFEAKISDFGLSRMVNASMTKTPTEMLGTVPWTAPEYLNGNRIAERDEKGDTYSFAVILWELITRQFPWQHKNYTMLDVMQLVNSGERLEIPQSCPQELRTLMEECWNAGNNTEKR